MKIDIRDMKLDVSVEAEGGRIVDITIQEAFKEIDADPLNNDKDLMQEIYEEIEETVIDDYMSLQENQWSEER